MVITIYSIFKYRYIRGVSNRCNSVNTVPNNNWYFGQYT